MLHLQDHPLMKRKITEQFPDQCYISDEGSEIDSKYSIHPSFIIVLRSKSLKISMMLMFRLCFVLSFIKLSVGKKPKERFSLGIQFLVVAAP